MFLSRFACVISLIIITNTVSSQDRTYNVYLDKDNSPSSGCTINQPEFSTNFNGLDGCIQITTSPPSVSVASLNYFKSTGSRFNSGASIVNSAKGLNTGENGFDVFETEISSFDLNIRKSTQARLYSSAESTNSTSKVTRYSSVV